jgi:hypothetical protein
MPEACTTQQYPCRISMAATDHRAAFALLREHVQKT